MSRAVFYIVAICGCAALTGCGPAESPARAEAAATQPESAPAARQGPPPTAIAAPSKETPETPPSRAPDALDKLKSQLHEIAAERIAAPPRPSAQPLPAPDASAQDDVEELRAEMHELRKEVARLQETVDAAMAYLVGELGDENRRLKKDLAPPDEMAQVDNTADSAPAAPEDLPPAPLPAVDYGAEGYLAVKEWGRTPEQAKEMSGDVASLRGMICAVAPGTTDDALKAIAKRLRDACAGYDNVNIEVFDDDAAARDYAERNVRSTAHFVMNITRHKASGRDAIVIVREDGAREIVVE